MSDIVRFGRFEIRTIERQLCVDGQPATLGSRAFDLLCALVERRERLVTKNELLEVVWPGLVVEENNLQVQISALRKILGASVIATIPGRGYRFTAVLEPAMRGGKGGHGGNDGIAGGASALRTDSAGGSRGGVDGTVADGQSAGAVHRAGSGDAQRASASARFAAPTAGNASPGPSPARLLIADDNKVNRLLLGRTLELQGHHISSVDNGRAALDLLRRERCDLLLLDLEMPEMDGYAVLEALAVDSNLRDLPVIVTSSVEGVTEVARCIELGADDFLHKPVNPVLLKARVGASLEKKRLRDQQKALIERYATGAAAGEGGAGDAAANLSLGGRRVRATILATRLVGFTAFAEKESPEETIELLNLWYTLMFDAVRSQRGGVNRMSGDGLMAVFGAPVPSDDANEAPLAAVRAALDMIEMLEIFNAERANAGKPSVAIAVGIATGDVIAGTTGTPQRAAYTCVGETVNAAAALEAQALAAPTRAILIDAATHAAVAGRVATDPVAADARGRKAAPAVHAVRTA